MWASIGLLAVATAAKSSFYISTNVRNGPCFLYLKVCQEDAGAGSADRAWWSQPP